MAKRMITLNTSRAHRALKDLLAQVAKADPVDLKARVNPRLEITEVADWVEALESAALTLADWCPNKRGNAPFTFDVEPKSRRR